MATILVVCTGNICRSPLAEGFLRAALTERVGDAAPRVWSAGVIGQAGGAAMADAVRAGSERGIDISAHRVRRLAGNDVRHADLVVAMAAEHRDAVRDAVPEAGSKTFTLKELVRLLEETPSDPGREASVDDLLRDRVAAADRARRAPASSGRIGYDEDIVDPLGMPYETYRAVAWELDEWVRRLAAALFDRTAERSATADRR